MEQPVGGLVRSHVGSALGRVVNIEIAHQDCPSWFGFPLEGFDDG